MLMNYVFFSTSAEKPDYVNNPNCIILPVRINIERVNWKSGEVTEWSLGKGFSVFQKVAAMKRPDVEAMSPEDLKKNCEACSFLEPIVTYKFQRPMSCSIYSTSPKLLGPKQGSVMRGTYLGFANDEHIFLSEDKKNTFAVLMIGGVLIEEENEKF